MYFIPSRLVLYNYAIFETVFCFCAAQTLVRQPFRPSPSKHNTWYLIHSVAVIDHVEVENNIEKIMGVNGLLPGMDNGG